MKGTGFIVYDIRSGRSAGWIRGDEIRRARHQAAKLFKLDVDDLVLVDGYALSKRTPVQKKQKKGRTR